MKKLIVEMLLDAKLIDQATLKKVLDIQIKSGDEIGKILVDANIISEENLLKFLAQQWDVPFINLFFHEADPEFLTLLPEAHARKYGAVVIGKVDKKFQVGMVNPIDINAIDAISKLLRRPIIPVLVSERAMLAVFNRIYRRTNEIRSFAQELSHEIGQEAARQGDQLFEEIGETDEERAPVVKLLNSLFHDAVQTNTSDIHIEPGDKNLRIRFRIDGVLNEHILDDKRIAGPLIQRLKLRANLDISEQRIPQDGSFAFVSKKRAYDVRLSTLPTVYGESLVMRLLEHSTAITDLNQLGIDPVIVKRIETIYSKPYGMLLVTGPTGSGKSTTLYSILTRLNTPERKIITVEDPVEYRLTRIAQIQVNPKIDLTFAKVLRAILRQDPDVIMIGEIRDTETSSIAMRAAVTGHLVLATLHTNDSISSAMRLIDMGAEGFMVAAAVKAILAQRLVRNLCKVCIKDHKPDELERNWLISLHADPDKVQCKDAEGCSHCSYHGYSGRTGVYELLEFDDDMINALRNNDTVRFAKAAQASKIYTPLAQSLLNLVVKGITSVNEAIRIIGQADEMKLEHREPHG